MKKLILLFILAAIYSNSYSQRWELFKNDISHYTIPQPNTVYAKFGYTDSVAITLIVDTIIINQNNKTIVFKKDYSGSFGTYPRLCIGPSPSLFGDSLIEYTDSSIYFIKNKKVIWKDAIQWVFYKDSLNNILIIHLDSTYVLNGDSIKSYSFSSNSPLAFDSTIFNTPFIVSKTNGLINGFDFSYFPYQIKSITFLKSNYIKSFDIYDYEINDEIHYVNKQEIYYLNPSYDLYILKVINKTIHNQDSITYTFERKIREDRIVNIGSGFPPNLQHQYRSYLDTISKSYQLNSTILSGTYKDISSFGNQLVNYGSIGFYDSDYGVPSYIELGQMFRFFDTICDNTFEAEDYTEYIFGIGKFKHQSSGDLSMWSIDEENLLYYKKGSRTWGTPITITILTSIEENVLSQINFYPNPVEDLFTIEDLVENCSYKLVDINGKIIKEGNFVNSSNQLNTENLHSGVYFLQLQSQKDIRTIKLLKQ